MINRMKTAELNRQIRDWSKLAKELRAEVSAVEQFLELSTVLLKEHENASPVDRQALLGVLLNRLDKLRMGDTADVARRLECEEYAFRIALREQVASALDEAAQREVPDEATATGAA